jgi:SAM-dependent methyltransferase
MSQSSDLLRQDSHFAFGKNWADYAKLVRDEQIAKATEGLQRLAAGSLQGKRVLDIGCGSGLHALAALRLGAAEVVSIDIDTHSVATARALLELHAPGKPWRVLELSVFDADPQALGRFDVVYSWGVLHHTGDMYRALRQAARLVAPNGQFIFALYRLTRLCWFWKIEKRWYARAGARAQAVARSVYVALMRLVWAFVVRFRDPNVGTFASYVRSYSNNRGMDFYHDVHDWMGGWPYESISPQQVERLMSELGMRRVRAFTLEGMRMGLFGSGCDEYVYASL